MPLHASFLLPLLLLLAGCSSSPTEPAVEVRGRLTNGAEPLTVQGREVGTGLIELKFLPLAADGKLGPGFFQASVAADGTYRVPGRQDRGIPPGKYRIVIRQWEPYPQTDKLGGRFDEQHS